MQISGNSRSIYNVLVRGTLFTHRTGSYDQKLLQQDLCHNVTNAPKENP